jgi:hypothetical protein
MIKGRSRFRDQGPCWGRARSCRPSKPVKVITFDPRAGGRRVVYIACSALRAENEDRIAVFMARHDDLLIDANARRTRPACRRWPSIDRRSVPAFASVRRRPAPTGFVCDVNADVRAAVTSSPSFAGAGTNGEWVPASHDFDDLHSGSTQIYRIAEGTAESLPRPPFYQTEIAPVVLVVQIKAWYPTGDASIGRTPTQRSSPMERPNRRLSGRRGWRRWRSQLGNSDPSPKGAMAGVNRDRTASSRKTSKFMHRNRIMRFVDGIAHWKCGRYAYLLSHSRPAEARG